MTLGGEVGERRLGAAAIRHRAQAAFDRPFERDADAHLRFEHEQIEHRRRLPQQLSLRAILHAGEAMGAEHDDRADGRRERPGQAGPLPSLVPPYPGSDAARNPFATLHVMSRLVPAALLAQLLVPAAALAAAAEEKPKERVTEAMFVLIFAIFVLMAAIVAVEVRKHK